MMSERSRTSDESGFSLVELLTVIVILAVIGGFVVTAITTALQSSTRTQARIEAIQELETAIQRMARDIRAAEVLVLNPDDPRRSIRSRVQRDGLLEVRAFSLQDEGGDTVLVSETFPVGADEEALPTASQRLVTLVDNDETPLFTYFDRDGVELPPAQSTAARHVEITLIRAIPGQRAIETTTLVSIRSVRFGED